MQFDATRPRVHLGMGCRQSSTSSASAPLVTRMFAGPDSAAHSYNLIRTESATETGVIAFLGSANHGLRFEVAPTSHEAFPTGCVAGCNTKDFRVDLRLGLDSEFFSQSLWEW